MTLWIVIIAPPVQWGSHPSTKSPSTIERFRIPLQSKRFLILFDYIFLHTTKTFHFYLIWIRLEGYYIFKVFKDLPDFCYSKFLQAVQRNETDEFQFFFIRESHNQPLFYSPWLKHLIWKVVPLHKHLGTSRGGAFLPKTHTHTLYWIVVNFKSQKVWNVSKFGLHFESKKKLPIHCFACKSYNLQGCKVPKGCQTLYTWQHPFQLLHPSGEENTYTNSEWTCIFSRSDNLF